MKNYLMALLVLCYGQAMAQLKCKTVRTKENGSLQTCLHENGKISTSETWDKEKRNGTLKVYDHTSKELYTFFLRTYGGHASVHLQYHGNGQVSRIEYSDAPDAGIQFTHIIYMLDVKGLETSRTDLSYPNYCQIPPATMPPDLAEQKKKIDEEKKREEEKKKQELKEKSIFTTVFVLVNETRSALDISFKSRSPAIKDTLLHLKKKATAVIDSVKLDKFLDFEAWQTEVVKGRNKNNFKIIKAMPAGSPVKRVYTWHVLKAE